jgi:hypothetical protein
MFGKLGEIVVLLCMTFVTFHVRAECYLMTGYGEARINERRIKTRLEDKVISLPLIEGEIHKSGKSHPYTYGGGCQVFRYMWIELTHRDHFRASVNSSYWLEGWGKRTEPVSLVRTLEVYGPTLAVVFEIPVYRPVSVIAKVGAMRGTGYMSVFFPGINTEYAITKKEERVLPVGGAGVLLRVSKHISIAIEHEQFNNDFKYVSANFRYRF